MTNPSLDPQPLAQPEHLVAANQPMKTRSMPLAAVAAWEIFLAGPGDADLVAEYLDILAASINEPILEQGKTPLKVLAKNASGYKMQLGAAIFDAAVAKKTMNAFPEGSIGAMAIVAGNVEGALEAAKATPQRHQIMRDSNHVNILVQAMISEETELLKKLTARVNDRPLIDPYSTDSMSMTVLSSYFKKAPMPSLEVVKVFAECLLQSKNLGDVTSSYYQRYFGSLDKFGKTCMHVLAQRMNDVKIPDIRFAEIFTWLSAQTDINQPDSDDETALIAASHHNRPAVNRTLLEEGALLDWVTHKGRTALSVAAYHGHSELISLYMQYDLDQANVDPNTKRCGSDTERLRVPLLAAKSKHWGALKEYLSFSAAGINQHEPTEDRHTPLILAIKELESSVVSSLIKSGVDINAQNGHGWTAVHYAAHHFQGKSLKERNDPATRILFDLITHGGRLEQADTNGITPLEVILQRTDVGSNELLFSVNINLLSEWVFDGNKALAEQYVDELHLLPMVTQAVLTDIHPVVTKAVDWKQLNQMKLNVTNHLKFRQARSDVCSILVDCFNYSVATFGLISLEPFPPVKKLYESIPTDWQWPAVAAVGVVMGLARATDFRGNMERFQNIGYAAAAFGSKIRKNILSPAMAVLRGSASTEHGQLRHVVKYFRAMRKSCLKIVLASKAFVHILKRESLAGVPPSELANKLDPEMMKALGEMSHQEFQKFKAQARLNARRASHEVSKGTAP